MVRGPQLSHTLSLKDADFTALPTSKSLHRLRPAKKHLQSLLPEELAHRTNLLQLLATGHLSLLALKLI